MRRSLAVLTGLSTLAALPAAAPAAGSQHRTTAGPACSIATVRALIRTSPLYRENVRNGGGQIGVLCTDINRDGQRDAFFAVKSGGNMGALGHGTVLADEGNARLVRWAGVSGALGRLDGRPATATPVHESGDPRCCPSGGYDVRLFGWSGGRVVVVTRIHRERDAFPEGFDDAVRWSTR